MLDGDENGEDLGDYLRTEVGLFRKRKVRAQRTPPGRVQGINDKAKKRAAKRKLFLKVR